jgi:hypothetical protein
MPLVLVCWAFSQDFERQICPRGWFVARTWPGINLSSDRRAPPFVTYGA